MTETMDVRIAAALSDVLGTDFVNQAFTKTNANDRELEARIAAITLASLGGVPLSSANAVNGYLKLDASGKAAMAQLYAGVAGGLGTLDPVTGKQPLSQVNDTILGAVDYQGAWNASTNTPTLDATGTGRSKGDYYVVSVGGATNLAGKTDWQPKDWIVWNGAAWEFVDNTDSVTSVFGRGAAVLAQAGDYTATQITNTPAGTIAAATVQAALDELDAEKVATTDTRLTNTRTPTDGSVTTIKMAADNKAIIICTSTTRPVSPVEGQHIYETDTDATLKNTGTPAAPVWAALGGGGTAGYVSQEYIEGLTLAWASPGTNHANLSVSSGSAYVPSKSGVLDVPVSLSPAAGTFLANTWYYAYLFDNAGTPVLELSTVAPAAPYRGTARVRSGGLAADNARRFVGQVRTDGAATPAMRPFSMLGDQIIYTGPLFRVINGVAAVTGLVADFSGIAPPGVTLSVYSTYLGGGGPAGFSQLQVILSGTAAVAVFNLTNAASAFASLSVWLPVSPPTPSFIYTTSVSASNLIYLDVAGYSFAR